MSFFSKIKNIATGLGTKIMSVFEKTQKNKTDYEEIKSLLLQQDFSPQLVKELMEDIEQTKEELNLIIPKIKKRILLDLKKRESDFFSTILEKKAVFFFVGANGAGKTSTVIKFAKWLSNKEKSVVVIAADTFRDAAIDQIKELCDKNNISIIVPDNQIKKSSAAVFSGIEKAKEDYIIIDTAGCSYTREDLLKELEKTIKVGKKAASCDSYVFGVLDANTGQSVFKVIEKFNQHCNLDGIIFSKIDGMEKCGIIPSVAHKEKFPILFVSKGEEITDLEVFNPEELVQEIIK